MNKDDFTNSVAVAATRRQRSTGRGFCKIHLRLFFPGLFLLCFVSAMSDQQVLTREERALAREEKLQRYLQKKNSKQIETSNGELVMLALPGPLFPQVDFRPPVQEECIGLSLSFPMKHAFGPKETDPAGRCERKLGNPFVVNGTPLYLEADPQVLSLAHAELTAASVWDCSLMLAKYVEKHKQRFKGKTVLELGSGQGVVGIATALCGAQMVIMTDVSAALPSIRGNILLNKLEGKAREAEVDWFKAEAHLQDIPAADVILAADVVWLEALVIPFVQALVLALKAGRQAHGPRSYALLCHKTRSRYTDDLLMKGLADNGLSLDTVPVEEHHESWTTSELSLWRIRHSDDV